MQQGSLPCSGRASNHKAAQSINQLLFGRARYRDGTHVVPLGLKEDDKVLPPAPGSGSSKVLAVAEQCRPRRLCPLRPPNDLHQVSEGPDLLSTVRPQVQRCYNYCPKEAMQVLVRRLTTKGGAPVAQQVP